MSSQLENIQNWLEQDPLKLSGWFCENYMNLNDDKCHLLVFGDKTSDVSVTVGNSLIKESIEEKPSIIILVSKPPTFSL